jgi:hypothetical protein
VDPADVIPIVEAVRAYPVLAGLQAVIGAGWRFTEALDEQGITALKGVRHYPHAPDFMDAIKIVDETDAFGFRAQHPDRMLWAKEGNLADVVDGLLNLPDPAAPHAPFLAISSTPKKLWTPNQNR